MNIFALNINPSIASQMHTDKHIVKMPLETAQLLCTAQNLNGIAGRYKSTHINHPCSIWTRQSLSNYKWLGELGLELCKEYTFRYNKVHACEKVIKECLINLPSIQDIGLTPFATAMPDECKVENDPIQSYKNYYLTHKTHLFSWKNRNADQIINSLTSK